MPGKGVAILHKAECPLRWAISHKEIEQGMLSELLIADDYTVPSEVSKILPFTFLFNINTKLLTSMTQHNFLIYTQLFDPLISQGFLVCRYLFNWGVLCY